MGTMNKKLTDNPNFIKVLSIFLALILWFFVSGDRQDALGNEVRLTFTNIPLAYRNLGQDLAITGIQESVTLSLQGVPQAFDGLTPAHLEAYVDLNGKKEGHHEIRINAVAPRGVSIVSINPAKVNIVLEDLITRQMTVESILQGKPGGGLVVDEVNFTPGEVFIRGRLPKVDLINKVVFRLNISNAEDSIVDNARLEPLDSRGNFIQGITIIPEQVEVVVSFVLPQKDIPVEVSLKSNGSMVDTITVEPSIVRVKAPGDLLDGITAIYTEEIDLEGRDSAFSIDVPLVFPEGFIPIDHHTVRVRIYLLD